MESLLIFARGPALYFAFAVCGLGMLRLLGLAAAELACAYWRAGNQRMPHRWVLRQSLRWIVPVNALRGARLPYTAASLAFHLGLLASLFLPGHLAVLKRGLGFGWPALPPGLSDALTLLGLAGAAGLLLFRLGSRQLRALSGFQDWWLLVLCAVPVVSGYFVAHPAANPLPFSLIYLVHLLSAELLLALVPFTKLAHVALFAFTRVSWELGWHFVPGAGERVRIALGKQGEPV